jgi:hypothetical protein
MTTPADAMLLRAIADHHQHDDECWDDWVPELRRIADQLDPPEITYPPVGEPVIVLERGDCTAEIRPLLVHAENVPPWVLSWSDGIANEWNESYDFLSTAILRLAALAFCSEHDWEVGFRATDAAEFDPTARAFWTLAVTDPPDAAG